MTRLPVAAGPLLLLVATLPYLVLLARNARIPVPLVWLGALVFFQLLSAVVFGMSLSNLLDFDFYRRDAKFFLAYAPMAVAGTLGLSLGVLERQLRAFVAVTTVLCAAGILEYGFGMVGGPVGILVSRAPDGLLYFSGLATSHNAAASIYAVAAAFTCGHLLSGSWRGRIWWLALALQCTAIVLTLSRSFLAAVLVVLLAAFWIWGRRRHVATFLVLGALVVAVFGRDMVRRFVELRDPVEVYNVVQRIAYWERAGEYVLRSPWLGVGFSRFNDVPTRQFAGVRGLLQWKAKATTVNDDAHAHNALLMVWAETGLVGVTLWVLFLVSLYREARRRMLLPAPHVLRGFGLGVVLSFAILLVASLAANNIVAPSGVWPAGYFAGAMLLLEPRGDRHSGGAIGTQGGPRGIGGACTVTS